MSQTALENRIEEIENKGFLRRCSNRIKSAGRLIFCTAVAGYALMQILNPSYAEETNIAYIEQVSPVIAGSDAHYIEQIGVNNVIRLEQIAQTGNNAATVEQEGDGNYVVGAGRDDSGHASVDLSTEAYQEGSDNFLKIVQRGDGNKVGLYQSANGSNEAWFEQTGNSHIADVIQENSSIAGGNYVMIIQEGKGQIARIYQESSSGNNISVISQTTK